MRCATASTELSSEALHAELRGFRVLFLTLAIVLVKLANASKCKDARIPNLSCFLLLVFRRMHVADLSCFPCHEDQCDPGKDGVPCAFPRLKNPWQGCASSCGGLVRDAQQKPGLGRRGLVLTLHLFADVMLLSDELR